MIVILVASDLLGPNFSAVGRCETQKRHLIRAADAATETDHEVAARSHTFPHRPRAPNARLRARDRTPSCKAYSVWLIPPRDRACVSRAAQLCVTPFGRAAAN
jgi:hypothetical protein